MKGDDGTYAITERMFDVCWYRWAELLFDGTDGLIIWYLMVYRCNFLIVFFLSIKLYYHLFV
jgi:hypothetical protein